MAVSPSLKSYGISGRARLFEAIQQVKNANYERKCKAPYKKLEGTSFNDIELKNNPSLAIDYITAPPRMALYEKYSAEIFGIYLKYVSDEDIHSYSIDEVFIDATPYLMDGKLSAHDFARKIIKDVYTNTGITATAGIGTNLYLCKVAMDIVAKHAEPDKDGVRIGELDEMSYRKLLWNHRPLPDFWRVCRGYATKLEANGLYTMGDIARCSIGKATEFYNEDLLYKLFGVNAELLIDHAWGWEPCSIADIKAYKPSVNSISSGQVLQCPYAFDKARLVVQEMTDLLVLDLVDKRLVTNQIVLTVGYDIENLTNPTIKRKYYGEITTDHYGRAIPKHAHGTTNLSRLTSSTKLIMQAVMKLYDDIVNKDLLVRRINITAGKVVSEDNVKLQVETKQLDLFTDYEAEERAQSEVEEELSKERNLQKAVLEIKKKYGKNSMLKGMNLEEGATAKERNEQIGGHKA